MREGEEDLMVSCAQRGETRRGLLGRSGATAVAAGSGVLLAACGAQSGESAPAAGLSKEPITVAVAHNFPWRGQAAFDESVKTFQAKYPTLKVNELASAGDYNEKMVTMFAGGTPPDAMQVNNDAVPDFAGRGLLRSLEPLVARDKRDMSDYHQFALRIYKYGGKQFCLPEILNMTLAFVNKSALDERGLKVPSTDWKDKTWTLEAALDLGKALTKRGDPGSPIRWGAYTAESISRWFPFLWAFGGKVMDDDFEPKKLTFDSTESVQTLEYLQNLIWRDRVVPTPDEIKGQTVPDLFRRGQIGIQYDLVSFINELYGVRDLEWRILPVPRGPAGRFNRMAGNGYGVGSQTKNVNEAWEFVKHLTGPEAPDYSPDQIRSIPATKKKIANPKFLDFLPADGRKTILDTLEYLRVQPLHQKWLQIDLQAIRPELAPVFLNQRSPRDGVKQVIAKAAAILGTS
jgi:multiple sugar transport system substrate-binding protein